MPLVTSKQMLLNASRGGYAVAAFNIENMEMAQAVINAAAECESPALLQTTPSTLRYAAPAVFVALVNALACEARVPVALHLDHGNSLDLVTKALSVGYTSIMFDGSVLPFHENVAFTKQAVVAANGVIPVEGELGRIGGKEDDLTVEENAGTDPKQAASFVHLTGVDSLAVSIGTAHGFYKEKPVLNLSLLSSLRAVVDVPLVLHGASGLLSEDVRECIKRGICKVNFATELRAAFTDGVKEALHEDWELFDPKTLGEIGKRRVKELVMARIELCDCAGKA